MEILLGAGVRKGSYNGSSQAQEMGGEERPGLLVQ